MSKVLCPRCGQFGKTPACYLCNTERYVPQELATAYALCGFSKYADRVSAEEVEQIELLKRLYWVEDEHDQT